MKILRLALPVLLAFLCCSSIVAQQTSAPIVFNITDPVLIPNIVTTAPTSTSAGSPQFTITVNGANFQANSVVQWTPAGGGATTALVTAFVSATKLTAIVPSTLVTAKSQVNITVLNPILVSQHRVDLQWVASTTSGVSGYAIYRGTTPGGPYSKIASGITGLTATDSTVVNGQTYYYVSTASDAFGNESVFSNEAKAIIPA